MKNVGRKKAPLGIIAAAVVVLLLGSAMGGHFFGLFTLPFLPERTDSGEIARHPSAPTVETTAPPTTGQAKPNGSAGPAGSRGSTESGSPVESAEPTEPTGPTIHEMVNADGNGGLQDPARNPDRPAISSEEFRTLASSLTRFVNDHSLHDVIAVDSNFDYMLIRLASDVLFSSGTATINDEMLRILDHMASLIYHPYATYTVSGHTDNVPISTARFPSNRHLSADRAMAVSDRFISYGYDPRIVRIHAAADESPLETNDTPEGRQRNRRIEILVTMN